MTLELWTASYAHRYSDPCGAFVGTSREAVEAAVEAAMEYEARELIAYCEHEDENRDEDGRCSETCPECQGDCSYCDSDLVWYGAWPVWSAKDFARNLSAAKEIIRELRESESGVVGLDVHC